MKKIIQKFTNNHIVYFGYYLKKTDWNKLRSDFKFIKKKEGKAFSFMLLDLVYSTLKHGNSFHEYFYYEFYKKKAIERKAYANAGQMYEYQLIMNPLRHRHLIEDKLVFINNYKGFIDRSWLSLKKSTSEQILDFLNKHKKLVLKNSKGQAGQTIKIILSKDFTPEKLQSFAKTEDFNLLEEYVYQHQSIMEIAPNSLNTLRIITQIDNEARPIVIGTILRLGIGSETDNLSTGGLACPVDTETGIISGPAISFDITKPDYYSHPITGKKLVGFQIPYWKESLELAKNAAQLYPENRSVGWDIAIKDSGPILIEGNHNWGVRLWQMPVRKGLKHMLKQFN